MTELNLPGGGATRSLYLETGAFPTSTPDRALYERYGFEYRDPFGYID